MFYDQKAKLLTSGKVSDGMGGWIDSGEMVLDEITVASAPVSTEAVLRQHGVFTTSSMKLYTEDDLPEGDYHIRFKEKDYRIIQLNDYGKEKIFLLELM